MVDTYSRTLHTTVAPSEWPLALLCDKAALFPSVKRRWARLVLRMQGLPAAAMRTVDATNPDMLLLLRAFGVHELGEVTSGIAEGCPLAGM